MRNIVLATALVLTTLLGPGASALSVGPGCVYVGQTFVCTPTIDGIPVLTAIQGHAGNLVTNATDIVNNSGDQPGVFAVNTARGQVCAGSGNVQCRVMDGRVLLGGAFDGCEEEHNTNFYVAVQFADAATAFITNSLLAGTPLEGERICEEHWSTLRALATLP